jgi:hypothetical protein
MQEQDEDPISRNPVEWDMPDETRGPEAAARGLSIYRAAQTRRGRAYLALVIALLAFLVWVVVRFFENTDNLVFIVFAVLVSFGSMALYLSRGLRKFDDRLALKTRPADRRTVVLGTIVTVLIVVGIPALVIWLYTRIALPLP